MARSLQANCPEELYQSAPPERALCWHRSLAWHLAVRALCLGRPRAAPGPLHPSQRTQLCYIPFARSGMGTTLSFPQPPQGSPWLQQAHSSSCSQACPWTAAAHLEKPPQHQPARKDRKPSTTSSDCRAPSALNASPNPALQQPWVRCREGDVSAWMNSSLLLPSSLAFVARGIKSPSSWQNKAGEAGPELSVSLSKSPAVKPKGLRQGLAPGQAQSPAWGGQVKKTQQSKNQRR